MAESEAAAGVDMKEKFIYEGCDAGILDASLPMIDVPVIDFGLLSSPKSSTQELDKLGSALCSWGCFRVINHGMEPSYLEQVREVGQQFFSLPPETKNKYRTEHNVEGSEGYTERDAQDMKFLHWMDRLYLTARPKDKRPRQFWPKDPEAFEETLDDYVAKIEKMQEILLKAAAVTLNLEENCFLDMYGEEATLTVGCSLYPPCPRPDLVMGFRPHTDGTTFTYLLQYEQVDGLQIMKDDRWHRIQIIPEAIFINVGDQLKIMSNGIFESLQHRVVTNRERCRMSLAVFCFPNASKEIGPVKGVVNEARPRAYKTVKDYLTTIFESYGEGRIPIETAKL